MKSRVSVIFVIALIIMTITSINVFAHDTSYTSASDASIDLDTEGYDCVVVSGKDVDENYYTYYKDWTYVEDAGYHHYTYTAKLLYEGILDLENLGGQSLSLVNVYGSGDSSWDESAMLNVVYNSEPLKITYDVWPGDDRVATGDFLFTPPTDYSEGIVEFFIPNYVAETATLTVTGMHEDIDTANVIFRSYEDDWETSTILLEDNYTVNVADAYLKVWSNTDGYNTTNDSTVQVYYYDGLELVAQSDILVIQGVNILPSSSNWNTLEFYIKYYESYIEIVPLLESYEDASVLVIEAGQLPGGGAYNQTEETNLNVFEPYYFVYDETLTEGVKYQLAVYDNDDNLIYGPTVFIYAETTTNADPSQFTVDDVSGLEDLDGVVDTVEEMITRSTKGINAFTIVWQMLPPPFGMIFLFIGGSVILVLSIGVILLILGR